MLFACENRFQEGLELGGVFHLMVSNPEQWKHLFIHSISENLTAARIIALFIPKLAAVGSNRRQGESKVLTYWRDWLIEVEGLHKLCHKLLSV
jgi:hypothetical protein